MKPRARTPLWAHWPFWLLALLALAVWLLAWGPCAAPWRTACFLSGGGTGGEGWASPHYQGWLQYLHGPRWLPATTRPFHWPLASSAVGGDSLPLAAIVCKPLTLLLGLGEWQYFSVLSLANGLLISGCSVAIGEARQWRPVATLALGALLLTQALSWSQLHLSREALQLHGPLLLGLTWLIQRRTALLPWCLLCGASLGIHQAYTPMLVGAALVAQLSGPNRARVDSPPARARAILPRLAALGLALLLAVWLFGLPGEGARAGAPVWGANGLALLDPQQHSAILPPLAKGGAVEDGGFAYLGMGLASALLLCLAQMRAGHPDPWPLLPPLWWWMAGLLFLLALGPTWTLGETLITPPNAWLAVPGLRGFYATFPRPGCFAWPLVYTLLLWVVDVLARQRRHLLLFVLTALQLLETSVPLLVNLGHLHQKRFDPGAVRVRQVSSGFPAAASSAAPSPAVASPGSRKRGGER